MWPVFLQLKQRPSFCKQFLSSTLSAFSSAVLISMWSSFLTPRHWVLSQRPFSSRPHPRTFRHLCPSVPAGLVYVALPRLALTSAQRVCCFHAASAHPLRVVGQTGVFSKMALWRPGVNPCLKSMRVPASSSPHPANAQRCWNLAM